MSGPSLALSNLRAVVILIVLAFHSALAYLEFLPATPYPFDKSPYEWLAFPIIDEQRWFGFDLICSWQDIYLMSLMFFLSGLFVWPSLMRRGSWGYLKARLLRIGLPLVLAVYFLMPVAFYPAYAATAVDRSIGAYLQHYMALPFTPSGPLWFLWELVCLNIVASALHRFVPQTGDVLSRLSSSARLHPLRYFTLLVIASAIAYVPLALIFDPWSWSESGPFTFQLSRPLHYLVYFLAGIGVGAYGLERGLLAMDGFLAKRWVAWFAAALASLFAWMGTSALIFDQGSQAPILLQLLSDVAFVLACASGCFFFLALFLRFGQHRSPWYDSLSDNAYGMYLLHYPFVVWAQYLLLSVGLFALAKAAIVFCFALVTSWSASAFLRGIPFGSRLIGVKR